MKRLILLVSVLGLSFILTACGVLESKRAVERKSEI